MELAENYTESQYPLTNFKKSNYLINAKFKAGLLENQLLAFSLADVKEDGGHYQANLSTSRIRDILGKNYKDFYRLLKVAALKLLDLKIMIENPEEKSFEGINVITYCKSQNGSFTVRFNPELKEQILDLRHNYTTFNIMQLAKFDKVASFRLYETLKSRCYYPKNYTGIQDGKFRIEFSLSELRVLLNGVDMNHPKIAELFQNKENPDYDKIIATAEQLHAEDVAKGKPKKDTYPAPKWPRWDKLDQQAIRPACEEISEVSELNVSYTATMMGASHKRTGVIFLVTKKSLEENTADTQKADVDIDDLIDEARNIIKENISTKQIKAILNAAENDISKIEKAYNIAKQNDRDDFVGFMIAAIKNDYSEPVKSKKKKENAFHFSNQREYDYDEIERILLNK